MKSNHILCCAAACFAFSLAKSFAQTQRIQGKTALANRISRQVTISSEIDQSWKKFSGTLPPAAYRVRNSQGILTDQPNQNAQLINARAHIWKLRCLPVSRHSINVESVEDSSVWNNQWCALNSFQANLTTPSVNTQYEWKYEGPGDNYDKPFGERFTWAGATANTRLAFGESDPTNKSGTISVTVTETNQYPVFYHYHVLWHLPIENSKALKVRRDANFVVFGPKSYEEHPVGVGHGSIIDGTFELNKGQPLISGFIEGAAPVFDMASVAAGVMKEHILEIFLKAVSLTLDEQANGGFKEGIEHVPNNSDTWTESVMITNKERYNCVPAGSTWNECQMFKPFVVLHYDKYPYLCDEFNVHGYHGQEVESKWLPAQENYVRYAGVYEDHNTPPTAP